ncbi:MAG: outer membrane protein assembly factor BamA [Hyphomicrobiaceae bacterium]
MSRTGGLRWVVVLALLMQVPVLAVGDAVLTSATAQDSRIRDIRVVGNRRVEPETVRSYMRVSVGDAHDAGKVDQSLRALFQTGLFADVRIDREGSALVVTVVENPVINQIAFEGNYEVEKKTLESEVQLKPRAVYTRAKVQADVQRILDVYRRQGRFAATVEPKIIELEQSRVNLVFEINEGGATKVKSIQFIGNRAFSDSQLKDIITTSQQGWFDFLKGTAFYDPDRVNLDRELLRQYYLKNGYADARVVSGTADLDRDGSGFFLTFVVEEGEIYNFGDVRMESGLAGVTPQELMGEVLTKRGAVYNAADIDKTVERLTLVVSERGYAFARVRPKADRDPAGRVIALTYIIDEGPRVYIERINVIGNTRTKDYVIRREFRLAEGDAFNPLLVDRAKKRLQGLGFFKGVEVKRRPGSAPDRIVLDVELLEQPTGEISFGVGYSTAEGVIGDITFTERNLLGNGQFLRLKVGGSFERTQVDLSFTEPRFLDRNLSAGFDLFHKDIQDSQYQLYNSMKTGGSLRIGFPLSEQLWLTNYYTISRDEIYDVDKNFDPANGDNNVASRAIIDAEGVAYTSLVGTSLTYDQRNHPRNPTRGYYLQASTDFAGVGGDVQYARFMGEGRYYYPITEKITFVGRVMGGHIMGWGGDDVRLLDMFYRGGETIRGFERAGFGPRDVATDSALGGTTFYAVTAEVRFPLPLVPDDLGMSGAFFVDAGSLFGTSDRVKTLSASCGAPVPAGQVPNVCLENDSSLRVSAGTSLLWNSPLGPLRADFGFAIMKESYDKEQLFRFGASTKF